MGGGTGMGCARQMRGTAVLRYERRERQAVEGPVRLRGVCATDVGRALRNERIRQGLSHRDVSRRLGIPEDQLRAAESGTLGRTDQLSTLKTVRRFADLLGLPGDRYALAILEQWPTAVHGSAFGSGLAPGRRDEPTAATPAVGAAAAESLAAAGGSAAAGGLLGSVTPFDGLPLDATFVDLGLPLAPDRRPFGDGGAAGASVDTGEATGIVPAVPIATTESVVKRSATPAPVRAAVVVLGAAVLAGGALLAVDQVHPSWLRGIGAARTAVPAAAPAAHHTRPDAPATATAAPGVGHRSGSSGAVVTDALRPHPTSSGTATLDAGPAPVRVTISAAGGPCWVQVTSPTASSALFAGVVPAGSHRSFTVAHGVSVQLGSSAGRVSVASRSGRLSTYRAPVAPFTLSVRTSG